MKPIQPISIRRDGQTVEANTIDMRLVGDNLLDSCTVYYELFSTEEVQDEKIYTSLTTGNVTIAWEDYDNLDTANGVDINEEIYRYVAKSLNVELV